MILLIHAFRYFLTLSVFTVYLFFTILAFFFHTAWIYNYFLNVQHPRESTYFNIAVMYCCYFVRVEVQEKRREGQERKKHVWHQNMPQMWKGKYLYYIFIILGAAKIRRDSIILPNIENEITLLTRSLNPTSRANFDHFPAYQPNLMT